MPKIPPLNQPRSKTDLFVSFTLLALQGFGGVLAVVQRELVEKKRWMTREQFIEDWAVAQIMPGPNVVNLSLMIGGRYFGLPGALAGLAQHFSRSADLCRHACSRACRAAAFAGGAARHRLEEGLGQLQARGLAFNNYTFLRQASKRGDFDVRLWNTAKGAQLAIYPNLNVEDPVWRKLNRDERFRRALSLAINRREINQVVYFGLAVEGHNTVLPASGLYDPKFREARFDIAADKPWIRSLTLRLTTVAVNDCATVTFRFQIAGDPVSAVLGATEQDQLIVLLQQFSDASMTPVFRNQFKHMLDIGFRLRRTGVMAHWAALITRNEL